MYAQSPNPPEVSATISPRDKAPASDPDMDSYNNCYLRDFGYQYLYDVAASQSLPLFFFYCSARDSVAG